MAFLWMNRRSGPLHLRNNSRGVESATLEFPTPPPWRLSQSNRAPRSVWTIHLSAPLTGPVAGGDDGEELVADEPVDGGRLSTS